MLFLGVGDVRQDEVAAGKVVGVALADLIAKQPTGGGPVKGA
jgi:hypothetical protein